MVLRVTTARANSWKGGSPLAWCTGRTSPSPQGRSDMRPVIVLHGRGGSEDIAFLDPSDIRVPAAQIYPRGPVEMGDHYAWAESRSTGQGWAQEQAAAVRAFRSFVEEVSRCYGKPLVVGHSQGAHMAFGIMLARSSLRR